MNIIWHDYYKSIAANSSIAYTQNWSLILLQIKQESSLLKKRIEFHDFESMEWPSVVFKVLIVMSFSLFATITSSTSITVNYVKPFAHKITSPCSDVQRPCLTLNEYLSNLDVYFVNNTIFYFYPGMHKLDYSLVLENLYNFSFQGWPSGNQVVSITVSSLTGISLNGSYNIKISSIRFVLYNNFTFILKF